MVKNKLIIIAEQDRRIVSEARAAIVARVGIRARYLSHKRKTGVVRKLQIGDVRPPAAALVRHRIAPWDWGECQDHLINSALYTNISWLGGTWIIEING